MIIFKFLVLMLACLSVYMVYKADFYTVTAGLALVLAMACVMCLFVI